MAPVIPIRPVVSTSYAPMGPQETHELHLLLSELQDERVYSRLREALWISVVVHLVVLIALILSPKYMGGNGVAVATDAELLRQKQLTYLELPPDAQRMLARQPKTNIISDKDRVATSRNPSVDKKTLDELRDNRRPGAPGAQASAQRPSPASPPQPQTARAPEPEQQTLAGPAPANQLAHLEQPPNPSGRPTFATPSLSAGSAIEQAARATAAARGAGQGGDYGLGPGAAQGNIKSNIDVLSDTMGVDFGPYLSRVLHDVRENWYNLIPEVARAPLMKRGKVSIEFAILKDGRVAGMKLGGPSGDVALDRAAWGGITGSNPFPPLPADFHGEYLALRFHFYYNPERGELR